MKVKQDIFLIVATVFCIFIVILLLASYGSASEGHGFSFASGFIFGTIISQFLFLFFNSINDFKIKKIKKTKREKDMKYWWNNGKPPDFTDS